MKPSDHQNLSSSIQILENRIGLYEQQIAEALAPYEPASTTLAWFDTLRAIEECINLVTVDLGDEAFSNELMSLPVAGLQANPEHFARVCQNLQKRFGRNFESRFAKLVLQGSAIAAGFSSMGFFDIAAGFYSLGTMIGYLQSRRRHFVGILHLLPKACRGEEEVVPLDVINIFLPIIELTATQMMGAQNELIVKLCRAQLGLSGGKATELAMLDRFFLEPERARIIDMEISEKGREILKLRETLRPDRLFSAAELRNDILLTEALYDEFDLAGTDFKAAATLVRRLSTNFIDRDFWIKITPAALTELWDEHAVSSALQAAFVHDQPSYMACLSTYAPLVLVNGFYVSTVTLLSRFIYNWRERCLAHKKRYQIRSGFIFERAVASKLEKQGFKVQDITRINRHEFDVVTVRDAVIWNFQCKNNFVDLDRIENNAQRFARFNRRLVRSYERALNKERNREQILVEKLSLNMIEHITVSGFPVITDNPRIVPYSRLDTFAARADALEEVRTGTE